MSNTEHDIKVILRHLESARAALRRIPFSLDSLDTYNNASEAVCEIAYSIGYLETMARIAASLNRAEA